MINFQITAIVLGIVQCLSQRSRKPLPRAGIDGRDLRWIFQEAQHCVVPLSRLNQFCKKFLCLDFFRLIRCKFNTDKAKFWQLAVYKEFKHIWAQEDRDPCKPKGFGCFQMQCRIPLIHKCPNKRCIRTAVLQKQGKTNKPNKWFCCVV